MAIIGHIDNIDLALQTGLPHPLWVKIFAAIKELKSQFNEKSDEDKFTIPDTEFEGIVKKVATSSQTTDFEAHQKHIDIHFCYEPGEHIDLCHLNLNQLTISQAYDTTNDVTLFTPPQDYQRIAMRTGNYAILFPNDVHRPCQLLSGYSRVGKVVIKVPLATLTPLKPI